MKEIIIPSINYLLLPLPGTNRHALVNKKSNQTA
jgi:hypothetical protein